MAGLVGVLKQLGDLAEFAAEIFHGLHEEVMTTAARGHRLMLRVQQVEADLPSIEKALLYQTCHPHFLYNTGINWHANLQISHNLIVRGDMPRFIMDSYEECRGPPQLFILDKFDVAGAGACLKRYSDPSFFKVKLTSTGGMAEERENRASKLKKKGSSWRNSESPEFLLPPHINSRLQSTTSDQISEEVPVRVKLKSRLLNESGTSSRTYMERLFELLSPEQNFSSENYKIHSCIKMDSGYSIQITPEGHKVALDASANRETNKSQYSVKKEASELPANELVNQIKKVTALPAALPEPACVLQNTESTFHIMQNEIMNADESRIEGNDYQPVQQMLSPSSIQELDQKELSTDREFRTQGSADGYRSDDITSELDYYMDALTTMDSEVDTDNETRAKQGLGFANKKTEGMDFNIHKEHKLPAQCSESDSVENSTSIIFSTCYSDTSGHRSCTQEFHGNGTIFDVPTHSDSCQDETCDKTTENWRHGSVTEQKSLDPLSSKRMCNAKALDIPNSSSNFTDVSSSYFITDSTSTFIRLCPHEGPYKAENLNQISSDHVEINQEIAKGLDGELPCAQIKDSVMFSGSAKSSDIFSDDLLHMAEQPLAMKGNTLGNSNLEEGNKELVLEDMTDTLDKSHHNSHIEDENNLEHVSTGLAEESPRSSLFVGEAEEVMKHDSEAHSGGTIFSSPLRKSSIVLQPDSSVEDRIVAPGDDLTYLRSDESHENSNNSIEGKIPVTTAIPLKLKALSDAKEPQEFVNMDSTKFVQSCSGKEAFSADMHRQPYMLPDPFKDAVQIETVAASDDALNTNVSVEAYLGDHDPCYFWSAEASGSHMHLPMDLDPVICEEVSIDLLQMKKGSASKAGLHCHQESAIEDMGPPNHLQIKVANPFEKGPELRIGRKSDIKSLIHDNDDLEPSDQQFERANSIEWDKINYPTNLVDKPSDLAAEPDSHVNACNVNNKIPIDSIDTEQDLDLKASSLCDSVDKEGMSASTYFLSESTNPFDGALLAGIQPIMIPSQQECKHFEPADFQLGRVKFFEQKNNGSLSEFVGKQSNLELAADSHVFPGNGKIEEFDLSTKSICGQLQEGSVPLPCYFELCGSSLVSDSSCTGLSYFESVSVAFPGTMSQHLSEPHSHQVSISPLPDSNSLLESAEIKPPLPPLPPLEWRLGKPLTSLTSDLNNSQPSSGQNSFTGLLTIGKTGVLSPREDQKHQYGHYQALDGGVPFSLDSFSSSKDKGSDHCSPSLGEKMQHFKLSQLSPSSEERSQLDRLLPNAELERDQHCASSLKKEMMVESAPEDKTYQYGHVLGGEDKQLLNSSSLLPTYESKISGHGLVTLEEMYVPTPGNSTMQTSEDEKLKSKAYTILNRPYDPLIDAVASHDKSTLRKVPDVVRPSAKPKGDERDTLLEQIRKKSFNLKPAVGTKPNIRGPSTNLKVAAILEKANAIRQAFVGSDDDDGDSWSDS